MHMIVKKLDYGYLFSKGAWEKGNLEEPDFSKISHFVEKVLEKNKRPHSHTPRHTLDFSLVRKNDDQAPWAYGKEAALERLIVVANNKEGIYNQYNLGVGRKQNIDIVLHQNGEIYGLVELKSYPPAHTPTYAFIEVYKNYLLFEKKETVKELTLLAPLEYFLEFSKYNNAIEKFFVWIEKFEKTYNLQFKLKYIDLPKCEFHTIINGIDKMSNTQWVERSAVKKSAKETKKYDDLKPVSPQRDHLNEAQLKPLLIARWVEIQNRESWIRLKEKIGR